MGLIWASQFAVAVEAMANIGADVSQLAGIGITNQRETTIVWEICANWQLGKQFDVIMEEKTRERLLKGWKRAVRCALAWAEDAWQQ